MFERLSRDDAVTVGFAAQEAADLGHRGVGSDHLILGMLGNARSPIFELLTAQGFTLSAARDTVRAFHDHEEDGAADIEDEAQQSAQRYAEDRAALASIGIDLDKVREAVSDRFGDDLEEGWAARPPRGRGDHPRGAYPEGDRRGGRRGGPRRGPEGPHDPRFGPGFGRGPGGAPWGPPNGPWGRDGFGPGPRGERPEPPAPEDAWADGPAAGPWGGGPAEGPWAGGRGRRGPRGRGRPRFSPSAREALRLAVRTARKREEPSISADRLLLAILDTDDPAANALIESVTTVDNLRDALLARFPEEADARP